MISNADTVGVFQVESRAQMSMLPRLRPNCFYDLVIEVAIVRPGPIQGNMVHPYLRRRNGEEPVEYPSEALRQVLTKTLGVPLFQEQAMKLAMVAAGFSAEDADRLRRAMAAWRRSGAIEQFRHKMIDGMLNNGYTRDFAERCFEQIRGFGEYGFPESHAASFALLVYVSAWLKRYHPAAFAAALLNSQPMGFYAPAQLVRDAKEHGVPVRPVDVNHSEWDCTLEQIHRRGAEDGAEPAENSENGSATENTKNTESIPCGSSQWHGRLARASDVRTEETPAPQDARYAKSGIQNPTYSIDPSVPSMASNPSPRPPRPPLRLGGEPDAPETWGAHGPALRLGFRQIKGFSEAFASQLLASRQRHGPFTTIEQFHRRTRLPVQAIRRLAEADAFGSLSLTRREALWQTLPLKDNDLPLFEEEANLIPETRTLNPEPIPPCLRASVPSCLLPPMPLPQEVLTDYATIGLSLKKHPVALIRDQLNAMRIATAAQLQQAPAGRWIKVAGLVLIRQRPGTANGIVFETLEDETGVANLILRPDIFDRHPAAARHAWLLQADGYVERQGQVVHVMAKRLHDLSHLLDNYRHKSRDFH
jgi:error-prone DNA polymerase